MREYYIGVYISLFVWMLFGLIYPVKWYNFLVCALIIGFFQITEYLWKRTKEVQ